MVGAYNIVQPAISQCGTIIAVVSKHSAIDVISPKLVYPETSTIITLTMASSCIMLYKPVTILTYNYVRLTH